MSLRYINVENLQCRPTKNFFFSQNVGLCEMKDAKEYVASIET